MNFGKTNSQPPPQSGLECAKCEIRPGIIPCDCGECFCEECYFGKHLKRNPEHRQRPDQRYHSFWNNVTNVLSEIGEHNYSEKFKKDETTKWFGLVTKAPHRDRVSVIAVTPRLVKLLDDSVQIHDASPALQFPSIVSFVGLTGAGKSLLIRSLIHHSIEDDQFDLVEAPVPGVRSGKGSLLTTTGDVSLYPEPSTFGTKSPMFFADCEGIMGFEPLAARFQTDWSKSGRKYRIQVPMDRRTVVEKIYPRFLYTFSDVVCYVTRGPKSWAGTAIRLLEWSSVRAQTTINQRTLPALIIILNAPIIESNDWISDDTDALTSSFFHTIENEIEANDRLRALAAKYGDKCMSELFQRSYSSIYVHYIPLQGNGKLGTVDIIHKQTERLLARIKSDATRVQKDRARSLTRFDSKQLSTLTDLAFKHLATGTTEPFDFGECCQNIVIPDTLDSQFGEYFRRCLNPNMHLRLPACVSMLGSTILNNALFAREDPIFPSATFNAKIREVCKKAMDTFRDQNAICAYIDPESGAKCANTKSGHAKGHQSKSGAFMRGGDYIDEKDSVTTAQFISSVEKYIVSLIQKFGAGGCSNKKIWRKLCAEEHRTNIARLRFEGVYPRPGRAEADDPFNTTTICYGCLFRHSEYLLPCRHTICETCIRLNCRQDDPLKYTGKHTLDKCVICSTSVGSEWPFEVKLRPQLAGLRILTLDGGGVRSIIQLVTLQRLESLIGLGLPIGYFFDLMVGTSTGGILALGLGVQGSSAKEFIDQYKNICKVGFSGQRQNWNRVTSCLSRLLQSCLYFTDNLEEVLQSYFQPKNLFGLRNRCRVAVTTTVNSEAKLISNYNCGGAGRYFNSNMSLSDVARCASATPYYFKPKLIDGVICRDGGLEESNPIQLAVSESKAIWGPYSNYDLVLSVGSGAPSLNETQVSSEKYKGYEQPPWVWSPFLCKLSGEEEWIKFRESSTDRIAERSSRLNMRFAKDDPKFDDLPKMEEMEAEAKMFSKFEETRFRSAFSPIGGRPEHGVLAMLADRLRASLFFLQVNSIDESDGFIIIVKGIIRCRLEPKDIAFNTLLNMVSSFRVSREVIKYTPSPTTSPEYFGLDIVFSHESIDEAIRIDVNFGGKHWVAISGCPITIREIMEQWDSTEAQEDSEDIPESSSTPTDYDAEYEL